MSIWRLVTREIVHRKLSFLLSVLAVMVAVGCFVGAQTLLRADRLLTDHLLEERTQEVAAAVAEKEVIVEKAGADLKDAMRKQMLKLGFNVLIMPEDQELSELHLNGTISATMPEEYVDRLANSKIVTVNHLLPSVTQRIRWEEHDREIVLVGTRGEVPIAHRGLKKQLLEEVEPGKIVLGHELHQQLNLNDGDVIKLKGREFTVSKRHAERGTIDDVTAWINLGEAQEMLGMQNLINAILALECECAGDRITQVRAEIAGILPGTQVIERHSKALTRAEARAKAKEVAEKALADEKVAGELLIKQEQSSRKSLEDRHAEFSAMLIPVVVLGSAVMIGLLAFVNARQRTEEVGILRAIGLATSRITVVFLSKAVLIGILGGLLGSAVGVVAGLQLAELPPDGAISDVLQTSGVISAYSGAPVAALLMTALASWLPAIYAARQDPALALHAD